jgi:hypothetical protein
VIFGDLRHQAGKIAEVNRLRSRVTSSTRLSFTRGAITATGPGRDQPLIHGDLFGPGSSAVTAAGKVGRLPRHRQGADVLDLEAFAPKRELVSSRHGEPFPRPYDQASRTSRVSNVGDVEK